MTSTEKQKAKDNTTPGESPSVVPSGYDQHSFILQAIMENQKTLGKLESSIETLKQCINEQSTTLKNHGRILLVSSGVVLCLGVLGAFAINHAWPQIVALMTLDTKSIFRSSITPP